MHLLSQGEEAPLLPLPHPNIASYKYFLHSSFSEHNDFHTSDPRSHWCCQNRGDLEQTDDQTSVRQVSEPVGALRLVTHANSWIVFKLLEHVRTNNETAVRTSLVSSTYIQKMAG